jgi:hypothetical protein
LKSLISHAYLDTVCGSADYLLGIYQLHSLSYIHETLRRFI